ncbi:MFS transporter [Zavarzinia sp. CC-PAN008]|uniref:MFS transporter n=1 Tax=Zavarzinia sp. CC-PAN008 TaxID=3243332 RepID=UPI003F74A9EB
MTVSNPMPRGLVLLMAVTCGAAVGNNYLAQPLINVIAADFQVGVAAIAGVAMATQLGYAAGLFLFGPLGDRFERKRVILVLCGLLVASLVLVAASPSLPLLAIASFGMGLFATLAQQVVPFAAHLAPDARRGQVVGTVMSGLLLGILVARFAAGFLGDAFGWRAVYGLSAVLMSVLGLVLWRALPRAEAMTHEPYPALLRSTLDLGRRHRDLRFAAFNGACLFAAFAIFWVDLTPHLADLGMGPQVAGAFGLIGAVGALGAPLAGRMADKGGPDRVLSLGIALLVAGYVVVALAPHSLVALIVGTIVLDLGIQVALIGNQSRIFALDPAARSRINAFFMTIYFAGGASGSLIAGLVWEPWGWTGAVAAGLAAAVGAGLIHLAGRRSAAASA